MLKASHYKELRSSFDIQANQSMEELLQNSTAGFSDVLEKVCPPALLSATYVFSDVKAVFSFMFFSLCYS